jgi:hypothetical protein
VPAVVACLAHLPDNFPELSVWSIAPVSADDDRAGNTHHLQGFRVSESFVVLVERPQDFRRRLSRACVVVFANEFES